MYLANDHPDIDYAVNCLARRASKPTKVDDQKLRRVARYLRGHRVVLWQYEPSSEEFPSELILYCDADWGGDIRTRRSTSGGLIVWGTSTLGAWSKLQPVVALSAAEAEYYSIVTGVQRTLAVQALLSELNLKTRLVVRTDSSAAKQSIEKVGLLHVKHMSMRMLIF